MKKHFLFLCLSLLFSSSLWAQPYPNVKIGDSSDGGGYPPCEPSICINPTNPDNIVAGTILDRVYYSKDGGKTWTYKVLKSSYGVFGDPVVIADTKGNFYYLHLSSPDGKGWQSDKILDRIVCQKSEDGGKTWSDGGYMGFHHPKDQDKQWAVVNPTNDEIYATWTQFDKYDSRDPKDSTHILFAKSSDGGQTWSESVRINQIGGDCLDDDNTTEGAVPAVGPNGEIYVAWSLHEKIYFDKSLDGGKTWQKQDQVIAEQPGGWSISIPGINRCNGFPVTACDLSNSPHRGTIYVNWSDQRNGEKDTDIWLSKSTDGGKTWSEAKRVNDDPAGKQQFFNWMSIDPITGYIYIVFYDRRNYFDEQTDVYLATSTDGGETFVNEKISESPFRPTPLVFFGDYNNISAYNGVVRPIWTRLDQGKHSIWTALIDKRDLHSKTKNKAKKKRKKRSKRK